MQTGPKNTKKSFFLLAPTSSNQSIAHMTRLLVAQAPIQVILKSPTWSYWRVRLARDKPKSRATKASNNSNERWGARKACNLRPVMATRTYTMHSKRPCKNCRSKKRTQDNYCAKQVNRASQRIAKSDPTRAWNSEISARLTNGGCSEVKPRSGF